MPDRSSKSEDVKKENALDQTTDRDDNCENDIPEEIAEILEDLPKDKKTSMAKLMVQSIGITGRVSQESAISKKITSEHIGQYLEASKENMEKEFQEHRENKIFAVIIIIIALIFFGFLVVFLKDNPSLLEKLIYSIGGVIAGAFGGYGFGKRQNKQNEDD